MGPEVHPCPERTDGPAPPADPAHQAELIVSTLRPASVLCVTARPSELVAELRRRGVDARGGDGSLLDAPVGAVDLVVCAGVLERIAPEDTERALANLGAQTDDILFASSPDDFSDPGHVNIRPAESWAEMFVRLGFLRDLEYDASFLAPWAVRLRRAAEPVERIVAAYERTLARLLHENRERGRLVRAQESTLAGREAELTALRSRLAEAEARIETEIAPLQDEVARLSEDLSSGERRQFDLDQEHRRVRAELSAVQAELKALREAPSHRLAAGLARRARRLLPEGSRRGALVSAGVHTLLERRRRVAPADLEVSYRGTPWDPEWQLLHYHDWLERRKLGPVELTLMRSESATWTRQPLVSVIMPVYNPPVEWLEEAIASVVEQAYPNWELCIADDASPAPWVRTALADAAAADARIRVTLCDEHRGIAATSNAAMALATGELVTFVDHDDILRPQALYRVVALVNERDDVGVVYSDEDKLLVDGRRGEAMFKPEWSPEVLLGANYLTHLTVIRRSLVDAVGGFRAGFDGAQDHDLFLRVTEEAERRGLAVAHVPDVLYTWRQSPGSAALSHDAKPEAYVAGKRAIEEALSRRGRRGTVQPTTTPGWYHVREAIAGTPSVEIVIPTRDRLDLLRECITSIEQRSTYSNYRITIVDNDSCEPATLEYLRTTPHRVVRSPGVFNYSRIMNQAIAQVDADHVLLLNNDITVITGEWIEALVEQSQRPEVGAVGCRLLYPGGGVQHDGIAVSMGCTAINLDLSFVGYLASAIREVTAVTGACMMVRRAVYEELGGLDERLRVAFNDVDFCLRLWQRGYKVMFTPIAELQHRESASRGRLHPDEDALRFVTRWGHHSRLKDPFMNPNIKSLAPYALRLD